MMLFWIVLLALALVVALAVTAEGRRRSIKDADRRGSQGKFAHLSQGITHYRWHGPSRGPVLVAVHGLTTPSKVWDIVAAGLGGMGYRVLTYDLYGRGLSDAPKGDQDSGFFLQQLSDLLEHEELTEDLTMLGYSMGGSIVTAFTHAETHRVKRLILVATAGVETRESGYSRFCRTTPVIGDLIHNFLGPFRSKREGGSAMKHGAVPGLHEAFVDQLNRRGYFPAVLASRRGMLSDTQKAAHNAISLAAVPTIAIWAEKDEVIPLSALGTLVQWNRNVRQETIPDVGHDLLYTNPMAVIEKVGNVLIEPA